MRYALLATLVLAVVPVLVSGAFVGAYELEMDAEVIYEHGICDGNSWYHFIEEPATYKGGDVCTLDVTVNWLGDGIPERIFDNQPDTSCNLVDHYLIGIHAYAPRGRLVIGSADALSTCAFHSESKANTYDDTNMVMVRHNRSKYCPPKKALEIKTMVAVTGTLQAANGLGAWKYSNAKTGAGVSLNTQNGLMYVSGAAIFAGAPEPTGSVFTVGAVPSLSIPWTVIQRRQDSVGFTAVGPTVKAAWNTVDEIFHITTKIDIAASIWAMAASFSVTGTYSFTWIEDHYVMYWCGISCDYICADVDIDRVLYNAVE